MQTSESIKEISSALVSFHKAVGKIRKDAQNPFFKSKYASLSGILETIDEPLIANGLAIVQFPEGEHGLSTRIVHSSGEWMEATYFMRPTKDDPQGLGSAITYQRRYAVGAILSLNIDEDDDANAASAPKVNGANDDKPWLNEKDAAFVKAIEAIAKGTVTIQQVEAKYKLSKVVRAKLLGEHINN
jgi:hypothetical protein